MQASNGLLYGTTLNGGMYYAGVIFSYDIATNTCSKLLDFNYTNGAAPDCNILETKHPGLPEGISSITNANVFSIYPIPAAASITIADSKIEQLEFIDLLGRNFYSLKTSSSGKNLVDVTTFPNVFFVKTQSGIIRKVVKE